MIAKKAISKGEEEMIDSARVNEIFQDCLLKASFKDCLPKTSDDANDHIEANGITINVRFHPGRLEKHKNEIAAMLDELPDEFKKSKGGGMSFLNACNDKQGQQWTGFHRNMEQLFLLGLATGKAECLLPREMWKSLPGGMPYYVVND